MEDIAESLVVPSLLETQAFPRRQINCWEKCSRQSTKKKEEIKATVLKNSLAIWDHISIPLGWIPTSLKYHWTSYASQKFYLEKQTHLSFVYTSTSWPFVLSSHRSTPYKPSSFVKLKIEGWVERMRLSTGCNCSRCLNLLRAIAPTAQFAITCRNYSQKYSISLKKIESR